VVPLHSGEEVALTRTSALWGQRPQGRPSATQRPKGILGSRPVLHPVSATLIFVSNSGCWYIRIYRALARAGCLNDLPTEAVPRSREDRQLCRGAAGYTEGGRLCRRVPRLPISRLALRLARAMARLRARPRAPLLHHPDQHLLLAGSLRLGSTCIRPHTRAGAAQCRTRTSMTRRRSACARRYLNGLYARDGGPYAAGRDDRDDRHARAATRRGASQRPNRPQIARALSTTHDFLC
jgi:hypothetical protein